MKKTLTILLTFAMCFSLCMGFTGCGKDDDKEKLYNKYDLSEYIELPDYNSYEFEAIEPAKVTETEMQRGIEKDLAYYGISIKTTKGKVEKGDTVTISFTGEFADGSTSEDLNTENYSMVLGEGGHIEGFEEALYGATIGEEIIIKTRFPDPYYTNPDFSGKEVTFKVVVNSRDAIKLPELTDELIEEAHHGYYKNVDDYLASVKKYYEDLHKEEAISSVRDAILDKLLDETKVIKYPEEELQYETMIYVEEQTKNAANNNYQWDIYLKDNLGMTEDEFVQASEEYAKKIVKEEMIIYAIAQKEGLKISDKEYDAGLEDFLENTSMMSKEQFEEYVDMPLDEFANKYKFEKKLLKDKMLDVIYNKVVA